VERVPLPFFRASRRCFVMSFDVIINGKCLRPCSLLAPRLAPGTPKVVSVDKETNKGSTPSGTAMELLSGTVVPSGIFVMVP